MILFNDYHKECPRLNDEAHNLYFKAIRETHENLRNIRSKNRTYLNSQNSYQFPGKNIINNINEINDIIYSPADMQILDENQVPDAQKASVNADYPIVNLKFNKTTTNEMNTIKHSESFEVSKELHN